MILKTKLTLKINFNVTSTKAQSTPSTGIKLKVEGDYQHCPMCKAKFKR